jgi:predicted Zn-dependent protease with MMP-like domain
MSEALFERMRERAEARDFVAIEREAAEAMKNADPDLRADLWGYVAWAAIEQAKYQEALDAAQRSGDLLYEAEARIHLWEFAEARRALEEFEAEDDEDAADAAWFRGLIAEFEDEDPRPWFERAVELAPDLYTMPVRLEDEQIDEVVEEALIGLPDVVADEVGHAAVVLKNLPEPHPDVDPFSLGLYLGANRMERGHEDGGMLPSRIEIYRRNIERYAADPEDAVEELRITLLHEIAHHLGYEEEEMERLGLE